MSAAVNPGLKDTPVDMDKLLKAVGCPICGEMFTHPVTVVRPRARDREFPRCPNLIRSSRAEPSADSPRRPTSYLATTDGVPAHFLPRVHRQVRAARPGSEQRVPHVRHQAGEQSVRGEESREGSGQGEHRGQAEGVGGVGWEWRRGCARTGGGTGGGTGGIGARTGGTGGGTRGSSRAGARGCRAGAGSSGARVVNASSTTRPSRRVTTSGGCLLYTSPSPRDRQKSRMPSSA